MAKSTNQSAPQVNAVDAVAAKQRIYIDAIESDVVVRRVCKVMASSKASSFSGVG